MKPLSGNAPLAWIAALGFFFAVMWPYLVQGELPLAGLRQLTAPHIGWPLTAITVLMALFLSLPALQTRERLLICAGFALCLYLVVTFYVSPIAPLLLLFIGVNLVRETRPQREGQ